VPGLEEAFLAIAAFPQVYFDTALVPAADVVGMALQIVGPKRIRYGSDEPLHLIRSVPYLHPQKGKRLITEYPYHWVDSADHQAYKSLAVGVTHAHWQALRAIKAAVSDFSETEQRSVKQKFFHDNTKAFYGF